MTRRAAFAFGIACAATLGVALVPAQGRGAAEWTTSGFDAQRTGTIRTDPRISVEAMQKPGAFGAFTFLWKMKLESDPRAAGALTQPILLDRVIGFRGFKSIAFVATASETVHAVDTDFGVPLWKYHINYSASPPPVKGYSADCPGGLTAALSRPTAIAPAPPGAAGGGGRGGRSGGGVGEPGKGSLTLATAGQGRGGGGGARGAAPGVVPPGAAPGSAAAAAGLVPGALPGGARAGGPGGGGPFVPGGDAAYVVGSDGYLHALNVQNGWESMTPALFLPANTHATGLLIATAADGAAVAYAATTKGCSSQPDAVWAMDLASPQKIVTAFQAKGAIIAGTAGPALGRDGSVYIVTTDGESPLSSTVVALEPKTLTLKGTVTVPRANFAASPLVFQSSGQDILVAAGGGKLFLFDTGSLSSGPIATSASYGPSAFEPGALASWQDAEGVRWIAAPSSRGIVTMKVTDQNGKLAFVPGWTSREIPAPLPPLVVNGVMFAASGGTHAMPGVLYAIDAATGKDLWNSARTITSTVRSGLSAGQGTVYVPAPDGALYAFGFAIEK
jgi:outer membrane protein assembly factor BamB